MPNSMLGEPQQANAAETVDLAILVCICVCNTYFL